VRVVDLCWVPYTIYRVMPYLQLLALSNVQPEYKLLISTCFGQFQKFGKFELGSLVLSHPKETIFVRSEFLLIATSVSDLTFLAPLTSDIIL